MIKIDPLDEGGFQMDSRLSNQLSLSPHNGKDHFWPLQNSAAARTRATETIAPATVRAALAIYTRSVTASVAEGNFLLGILRIPKFKTVRQGKHSSLGGLLWNTFSGS